MTKRWDQMTYFEKLESIREDGRIAARKNEPDSNNPFDPDENEVEFTDRDDEWDLEPDALRGQTFTTHSEFHAAWLAGWTEVAMAKRSKA